MYTVYAVCGILAVLLVCGAEDNTTEYNCVSSYKEFEKKVFIDNTQNRYKLYQVFYPQNGHLPYGVDLVYETLLPNKTVLNITYTDFKCTTIKWRWISSPVFLFVRPKYLNILILLTLNYFREWTTPTVTLKVPYPCPNSTFDLLTQMTSLVDEYAIGKVNRQTPSGNVLGICRNNVSNSIYHKFQPHGRVPDFNYNFLEATPAIYLMSLIFGDFLMWIGSVLVLRWYLKGVVEMSYTYSYEHYGLWWGVTCFWFILVPIMMYSDVSVSIVTFLQYGNRVNYTATIIIIQVSLVVLTGLIIAGYYAHKTKPPAVPKILMIPAAFCCCSTQRAKSLVFGTALWINVVAAKLIMFFTILVILAILAEPFAAITNTLLLILVAFCITNILALLFTISAHFFTPKHQRTQGQGKTMLRAVVLIPLLAMIICLSFPVFSIGYLTNRGTQQSDVISFIGSASLPLILGAITFGLKKLIAKWLQLGNGPTTNQHQEGNNSQPLEDYVRYNKSVEV